MSDLYEQTNYILQQLQTAVKSPKPPPPYKSFAKTLTGENDTLEEIEAPENSLPEPDKSLLPAPEHVPIGFELWEALAYDLALDHTPRAQIAEAYSVTLEQLDYLENNEYFKKMLKVKKDEVAELGTDAAFTVKMRMVANRAMPQFMQRLVNPNTPTREFHSLFKTAIELARLMPQACNDDSPTTVVGTAVTFNIQGVPGLDHLSAKLDNNDTITDADFSEIIEHNISRIEATSDEDDGLQEL